MRLTCPNCGAQYQVPDDVIPPEGRDVQCSDCGQTWFEDGVGEEPADAPVSPAQAPASRELPRDVTDILREEAELERRLRAEEAAAGLESQPDLGLDGLPDYPEADTPSDDALPPPAPEKDRKGDKPRTRTVRGRRGNLPDIEEISSTLRSSGEAKPPPKRKDRAPERSRSGFLRGFSLSLLLVAVLVLIYSNAPDIARALPQSDPALSAFVASVDQARLWLDTQIRSVLN